MVNVVIVTVCYNDINNLKRTVNSVRKHKKKYHKYYVIDGMSSDGTYDFIRSNLDVIDDYIVQSDNGMYDGMNKILNLLKEECFIIWINAGDEIIDWKDYELEQMVNYSCAFFPVIQKINIEDKGYLVRPKIYLPFNEKNMMPKTLFRHQGFIVKKSVFEQYRYNLKIGQQADGLLMTLCQKNESIFLGENPLSVFYLDGVSNYNFKAGFISYLKIVKYLQLRKCHVLYYHCLYIFKNIIKIYMPPRIMIMLMRIAQFCREFISS